MLIYFEFTRSFYSVPSSSLSQRLVEALLRPLGGSLLCSRCACEIRGAEHSFSEEEKVAFSEHINQCRSGHSLVSRHLPLNSAADDLFTKTFDGLLFCNLINLAVPDTIDPRAINQKESLNVYQKSENINLAPNAARAIGCQVVNIGFRT